jgi:hypothetical protein
MANLTFSDRAKFQLKNQVCFRKDPRYSWFRFIVTTLCILPVNSLASPIPAMGSSALASSSKGYNFNLRGFRLTKGQTNWSLQSPPDSEARAVETKSHEISLRYQSPISHGFLAVKTETLSAPVNVEFYAKKWIRDYSYYGFDVLGAKAFNQGNARGYVIDLFHPKKSKQMRQVVFLRDKTAVIMTCSDEKSQFSLTLSNCNSILKTFAWLK